MTGRGPALLHAVFAVAVLASPAAVWAQGPPPPGPAGWVQAEAFYHNVTNDFGDWRGVALRLVAPAGRSTIWYVDGQVQKAFKDRGVYGVLANRRQLGADWFTLVGVGGGTGDFVLPDLRTDATVGKAWLPRRNLVTMVSTTYINAKEGFEDFAVSGSVALYLPGAVLEGGGRSNWSWPGSVQSSRAFGAITLGRERRRLLTARGSAGWEGYQLTDVVETRRRFRSQEASVSWREWLGAGVGFFLQGAYYDNPFYTRTGATLGIFRYW